MTTLFTKFGQDLILNIFWYPFSFIASFIIYRIGFQVSKRTFGNNRKYLFELYGRKLWAIPFLILFPIVWFICSVQSLFEITRVVYLLVGYVFLPIWMTCVIQILKLPEQRYCFFQIPMKYIFVFYLLLSGALELLVFYWQSHQIGAYYWEVTIQSIINIIYLIIGTIAIMSERPKQPNNQR